MAIPSCGVPMARSLRIQHSPDPDDAFVWWALASGKISLPGINARISTATMEQSNRACLEQLVDVAAISSAAWPHFSDHYVILAAGASVGRGYGPALAMLNGLSSADIGKRRVAVPGRMTTGATLLRLLYPEADAVEYPCNEVADAILRGEAIAGVLIHEALMTYADRGLHRAACLGNEWMRTTGLPLPVGVVVAHRRLGAELIAALSDAVRTSLEIAFENRIEAVDYAMQFSRNNDRAGCERFIEMFSNEDTIDLPQDCHAGLAELYSRMTTRRIIPYTPTLDVAGAERRHLLA